MKTVALRKKNKRDKERAKLNKLVKKRATTKKRISKLKTKTADGSPRPLSKVRSAIQKKRLKKIQSKINQNPRAQADRKAGAKKKATTAKKTTPPRGGKKIMIKKQKFIDKTPRGGKKKPVSKTDKIKRVGKKIGEGVKSTVRRKVNTVKKVVKKIRKESGLGPKKTIKDRYDNKNPYKKKMGDKESWLKSRGKKSAAPRKSRNLGKVMTGVFIDKNKDGTDDRIQGRRRRR